MSVYSPFGDDWKDCEDISLACCDCGLVHDIEFRRIQDKIQWKIDRNDRSTGQIRRHMKRKKEGVFEEE
jgi:hypothetical protein